MSRRAPSPTAHLDPRKPLNVPPLGPPLGGRQCAACRRWYPWENFYRSRRRPAAKRCLACIEGRGT